MSSVASPSPAPATPDDGPRTTRGDAPAGPAAGGPAPTRLRLPAGDRLAPPAITLAVALVLAGAGFVQGAGSALGPKALTEIVLVLAGALLVGLAAVRRPGPVGAACASAVALLAAVALLSALSITWADNPSDAWLVGNRLMAYLAAFAGAVAAARLAPQAWRSVLGGVVLASVVVCGYGLLTKALPAQLNDFELFARLREPFGYWNAVGLAGVLGLPGCLWLGARRDGPAALNALAYPALAVCLAATLMAYSRGALVAVAIGLVVWFTLVPLRLRAATVLGIGGAGGALIGVWSFGQDALTTDRAELSDRVGAGGELLVLVLALVVVLYLAGLAAGFVADLHVTDARTRRRAGIALLVVVALAPVAAAGALATTDSGLGGSVSSAWSSLTDTSAVGPSNDPSRLIATGSVRGRYWDQAFRMWEEDKLLGIGAGGYATGHVRFRKDLLDVRHAHGYIPETMAELGLVGLLLSLALVVAWFAAARTALLRARAERPAEFAGLATLGATAVVFGIHSTIDFTWAVPGVALTGLLCAGWVAGRAAPAADPAPARAQSARDPFRLAAVAVVALLALAAAWSSWQPLRAAQAADDAVAALQDGDIAEARELATTARERNPLAVEPLLDLAAVEQRAGRERAAEAALEEATRVQPANWLPWLRLADVRLFELSEPRRAMEAVRVAIYLNPRSWDITQRYLDVRRKLGGGR